MRESKKTKKKGKLQKKRIKEFNCSLTMGQSRR